ncbi:16S rRNA (cytidine(1402)-2'-O)-methyltransferase [Mobilicoccus pelagius]|nr:16S rRNA (cytidine(1402)-2'-O)-methyltransferase [Mobilicoccus pelagius]
MADPSTAPARSRTTGAGLTLAATPIGDPLDASLRLVAALQQASVIAAEDTRRVKKLASMLEIPLHGRVVAYHEHNEASLTPELVALMQAGERTLLVTDAGMPSVSDPGYRLVTACVEADVPVTCLPGPSAVLVALALSGLPVDRFCFEGFCPRKPGERRRRLEQVADERRTMVFFEAPHRLAATLASMAEAFGEDRRASVCRELTKTYEEVRRGELGELVEWAEGEVRGEITIVVEGASSRAVDPDAALADVLARVEAGERLKDACKAVAGPSGIPAPQLYDAAVAARRR